MGRWYNWLNELAVEVPDGQLRIRLHPAEGPVAAPYLSVAAKELLSDAPLSTDLSWCDRVVACFSTTLLDALAAGRGVLSVQFSPEIRRVAGGFAVFADPLFPVATTLRGLDFDALCRQASDRNVAALRASYLVNAGHAAAAAAAALDDLAHQTTSRVAAKVGR
jgi:hypothetical protein